MVFPFLTTVFASAESCSGCRRWSGAGLRSPLHFSCRGGGAGLVLVLVLLVLGLVLVTGAALNEVVRFD